MMACLKVKLLLEVLGKTNDDIVISGQTSPLPSIKQCWLQRAIPKLFFTIDFRSKGSYETRFKHYCFEGELQTNEKIVANVPRFLAEIESALF